MIVNNKAAEYAVLQKLAAFTKISKAEFVRESMYSQDTGEELPVYTYPILGERFRCIDPIFYSVSLGGGVSAFNLGQLLDPDKWLKSEFRAAFDAGMMYLDKRAHWNRYATTFHMLGSVWVMTKELEQYTAQGGGRFRGAILVQDPECSAIYVMQPIRNYLTGLLGPIAQE